MANVSLCCLGVVIGWARHLPSEVECLENRKARAKYYAGNVPKVLQCASIAMKPTRPSVGNTPGFQFFDSLTPNHQAQTLASSSYIRKTQGSFWPSEHTWA